jgi:hypothetical protein
MKSKVLAVTGVIAASVASFWLISLHAQQRQSTPANPALSTNWVGYLVLGEEESLDQISRGPHPVAKPEVEIGLRNDGVVVWRPTPGKGFGMLVIPLPHGQSGHKQTK